METKLDYENGTLTVTRIFDAPRQEVFDAWVEVGKVQKWWGCAQTTLVKSEIEPCVGGKYHHAMDIEGHGTFLKEGTFTEFEAPSRIAFSEPDGQSYTVDFLDLGAQTKVVLVHSGIREEFIEFVKPGWTAAFEKLGKLLAVPV